MRVDTMTASERIDTAVKLGKPDRVPVAPHIDFFACRYGGVTQRDMLFDVRKADAALERTIARLGAIDAQGLSYGGMAGVFRVMFPNPPVIPGTDGVPDDAQFQFVEKSVMEPGEYSLIRAEGPFHFLLGKLEVEHPELRSRLGVLRALAGLGLDARRISRSARRWRKQGVESLVGPNLTFTPLEWISLSLRSFNDFMTDLFRYKDEVKDACDAMMGLLLNIGAGLARTSGIPRVFIGGNRTSASFISPRQFEEFALEEWERACRFYTERGITPILHMDSDWTPFFHYFRDFPRASCILNLDGSSDIFKAKEILGDRMCIMGDVPAALLKLGEPDEVDEYCRRLIVEVGGDGGFILGSGCTVPPDAKPENVKAMLASVHRYRP
jgi:hypothetical protein